MISASKSRYEIVLGFDFSPSAETALDQAIEHAAGRSEVGLHALAVVDSHHRLADFGGTRKPDTDEVQGALQRVVDEKLAASGAGEMMVFAHVRIGNPAEEILRLSIETGADMIVVGTHGRRGIQRLVLGSVASEVVRKATVPVLVARPAVHEGAQIGEEIEPPCPRCVEVRLATDGTTWWCGTHDKPYVPPQRYEYKPAIPRSYRHDVMR